MPQSILVAGASGHLGREVIRCLKQRGHRVRALGRSPARLSMLASEADECVVANALERDSLRGVMDGVDRVVSCLGASVIPLPRYGARTFSAIDTPANANLIHAAAARGVEKFLYVSVFGADRLPQRDFVRAHERVVEKLRASGLAYAVVRPTGFFQSMEKIVLSAGHGLLPEHDGGRARTNPIHEADLARFCVDALFDPGSALERDVGGPDALTRREIAELAERSLLDGRKLHPVPIWTLRAGGFAIKPFYPRIGDLMEFIADVLMEDFVAPAFGEHRMEQYFSSDRGRIRTAATAAAIHPVP